MRRSLGADEYKMFQLGKLDTPFLESTIFSKCTAAGTLFTGTHKTNINAFVTVHNVTPEQNGVGH
jgi:hypothetical protein